MANIALDLGPISPPQIQDKPSPPIPQTPKTIHHLPNELLCTIISYLDSPQPSASGLRDLPTFRLTNSETSDLKAISRVSKRWRQLALPILFKHARFSLRNSSWQKGNPEQQILPFLSFVAKDPIAGHIQTFVLLAPDEKIAQDEDGNKMPAEVISFWHTIFKWIDPQEVLIIATVEGLGTLTTASLFMDDAFFFDGACQYLGFKRQTLPEAPIGDSEIPSHSELPPTRAEPPSSTIFDIRPWASLLLNEGSFVKVYHAMEFWLKRPPSVRPALPTLNKQTLT